MDKKPKLIPHLEGQDIKNSAEFLKELEIDVLARTLWGEARSEGKEGMEAVASVILNRTQIAKRSGGYWWGNTIIHVCQKPYQFSCWNKSDPNFKKLISVSEEDIHFATAKRVAYRAVLGFLKDKTYGATHYHTINISPYWTKNKKPTTRIGHHVFYTIIEE